MSTGRFSSRGLVCAPVTCVLGLALSMILSSPTGASLIEWDFDNPPANPPTIAEINAAGGMLVGDKIFSQFSVIAVPPAPGTIGVSPGANQIVVSGIKVGDDYGIQFNGPWVADAGAVINSTIGFKVSIADPWANLYLIKDNALRLTASNAAVPDALVDVVEAVYDAEPLLGNRIATKHVSDRYGSANDRLFDYSLFGEPPGSVMLSEIWVKKDITLIGGTLSGGVGGAHLSEFTQTFSQQLIPEPGTLVLLLGGLLGPALVAVRRRRRRLQYGNAA